MNDHSRAVPISLGFGIAPKTPHTNRDADMMMLPVTGEIARGISGTPDILAQPEGMLRASGILSPGVMTATRAPIIAVETVYATVLFADMRGYTALAERLPPARIVPLLDEFFALLASATAAHGGEVFHMAGDGMMAGFGVRVRGQHGAREALAAGCAMLQRFSSVATRWQRELSILTGIGVGLHLGEVAVGLLGPPGKKTATLVGDTANVAARLCSRARNGEVLFSSTVADALHSRSDAGPTAGRAAFLLLPQCALRGRSGLLDIWCVPVPERLAL